MASVILAIKYVGNYVYMVSMTDLFRQAEVLPLQNRGQNGMVYVFSSALTIPKNRQLKHSALRLTKRYVVVQNTDQVRFSGAFRENI